MILFNNHDPLLSIVPPVAVPLKLRLEELLTVAPDWIMILVALFILLTLNPPVTVTPEAKQTVPPAFTIILPLCVVPELTQITSPLLTVIAELLAAMLLVQPVH